MNIIAIVQARTNSSRFYNKVSAPICGHTLIELCLKRIKFSKLINGIVVAIPDSPQDDLLDRALREGGHTVYRGSELNVLDRYYNAAKVYKADIVVRITGDCPLIDPKLVDNVISACQNENVAYCSNIQPPTFPDGLDTEVFSFKALEFAQKNAHTPFDLEHVTPFLRNHPAISRFNVENKTNYSDLRWTVDVEEDFSFVESVYSFMHPNFEFSWEDVIALCKTKGGRKIMMNHSQKRNEGMNTKAGQSLWARATRIIPGGNMLLSKRPDLYLPDAWPTYFHSADGCKITDLNGNQYFDTHLMGVGTNILGYANSAVDKAVIEAISKSNMSTLNCPEEVILAEKLVAMHDWADMARFARTGGEANSIAVRLGRAASGKEKVAVCGYHGWHDWYLAANIGEKEQLGEHLLPGLDPKGVPRGLQNSVFTFEYNNFDQLSHLVSKHDIGVIKMEVKRNFEPQDNFLLKVRKLATDNCIVLIFDECTSGFRECFGGLHLKYGVNPDLAVFGKALGNGYAITAVIGKQEIMDEAQNTFVSSTFWTERIGPTAALKTLEVMEQIKSWDLITKIGNEIREKWYEIAQNNGVEIRVLGLPSLNNMNFISDAALQYKTLIAEKMLDEGFLASTQLYSCICHDEKTLSKYYDALSRVFEIIGKCEKGTDVAEFLNSPTVRPGFARLN